MLGVALFKSWWKVFLHPWTPVFRDELNRKSNIQALVGVLAAMTIIWAINQARSTTGGV